jgi:hypothetical protein
MRKPNQRQQALFALAAFALLLGFACQRQSIHPGAINKVDSDIYDSLLVAQAALNQAKVDFTAGKIPASAKDEINVAIRVYNVAQASWKAYHSGASKDLVALERDIAALTREVAKVIRLRGDK